MRSSETLAVLRDNADAIKNLGVTALFLYGSAARDELRDDSDIDLFIDYDPDGSFSLIEQIKVEEHLKKLLVRDVDLTTRAGLHPMLRTDIERSSIRVF